MSAETVSNDTKEDTKFSLNIEPTEISFLPIVTEGVVELALKFSTDGSKEENKYQNLLSLNVDYEEIFPLSVEEELHFQFLPIVTGNLLSEEKATQVQNELPVGFEEVIVVNDKTTEQNKLEECLINEILVTYEEVIVSSDLVLETKRPVKNGEPRLNVPPQEPKIDFSDMIATEDVSHITVIYDDLTIENDTALKDSMSEIDWASAFELENKVQSQEAITEIKKENEMEKELWDIPKPFFYDDAKLNNMALLEDISELGDHREIPHLNMLLQQENNASVKIRITELIASFSIEDDTSICFEPTISSERQSVFHSLFDVSDTEAKIILLDEIAEVGDEQELSLLESLVLSDHVILHKTAKRALEKLTSRLEITRETAVVKAPILEKETNTTILLDTGNLFELDFEFTSSDQEKKEIRHQYKDQKDGNTMFDRLCAMSTKLYDKE
jgi:hypothetical protein